MQGKKFGELAYFFPDGSVFGLVRLQLLLIASLDCLLSVRPIRRVLSVWQVCRLSCTLGCGKD